MIYLKGFGFLFSLYLFCEVGDLTWDSSIRGCSCECAPKKPGIQQVCVNGADVFSTAVRGMHAMWHVTVASSGNLAEAVPWKQVFH